MAEADGRVYIDTEIETDGFVSGGKEVEQAARRMADTVRKIGDSAKISLRKQTDAFIKQNQILAQQKAKVSSLEQEYVSLSETQIETDEFKELGKLIDSDTKKLNSLEDAQEKFLATGGKEDSSAYQKRKLKIDELKSSIQNAKNEQQQLLNTGGAYKPVDTSGVESKLFAEKQKLSQMNTSLGTSYEALKQKVVSYGGQTRNLVGIKGRLINSMGRLSASAKKAASAILGLNKSTNKSRMSMGRMLKTSLIMGMAFRVFSSVINGVKEGMNNLAQYSSDTNVDLSSLKSSLTQLKNSFATAFAPILTVVTPILAKFINLLSKAITYVGMFFASLAGKKSFTKAVEVQEDYAAGLKNTASSAKDAEKAMEGYLSPIDEINKMEKKDTANDAGTISPGEMFETQEIDSTISELANTIKDKFEPILQHFKDFGTRIKESTGDWFKDLDFGPLSESVDDLMDSLDPLVELLLGGLAFAYENVLLPIGKWLIETGLPLFIGDLAKAIELITVVIEKLIPILSYLWKNLLEPFGETVGKVATGILTALGGLLDFLIGVFTGDWERAFSGLDTIVQSFLNIFNARFGFIRDYILAPFDRFLQGVFAKDWTVTFGVLGDTLNAFFASAKQIWDGLMNVFNGIITFVNGVFAGDWGKAWEGVKQIFKGIFQSIMGVAKQPINGIIGYINALISGVASSVNAVIKLLNKLNIKIPDWLKHVPGASKFAGKSFGFNISTITAPKIPYLATGAVIPPNSPFVAMLGDQKRGTNIETPERLLRQIIREELGNKQSGNVTYRFTGQINRRVLFEEVITEAKIRQGQNGRNPFELA